MAELSGDVFITQETADEEEVVLFSGMLAQRYLSVPGPSVSKREDCVFHRDNCQQTDCFEGADKLQADKIMETISELSFSA